MINKPPSQSQTPPGKNLCSKNFCGTRAFSQENKLECWVIFASYDIFGCFVKDVAYIAAFF